MSHPDKNDRLTREQIERLRPIFIEAMTDGEGEYPAEVETIVEFALKWIAHCELFASSARNANAERYEWLRSHSWVDISLIKSVLNFGPGYQQTKPEILDAAIDAELARSDGKGDSNAS